MVGVDLGVALGLAGIATGLGSAVYARSQAAASRRQAEETRRVASVEISRALAERVREVRWKVATDPALLKEYVEANPAIGQAYGEPFTSGLILRDFLDATQDVYYLRKEGVVEDPYWRNWMASTLPITRLASYRRVHENAVARGAWQPEFVRFLEGAARGEPPDPLGRIDLTAAARAPAASGQRPS